MHLVHGGNGERPGDRAEGIFVWSGGEIGDRPPIFLADYIQNGGRSETYRLFVCLACHRTQCKIVAQNRWIGFVVPVDGTEQSTERDSVESVTFLEPLFLEMIENPPVGGTLLIRATLRTGKE